MKKLIVILLCIIFGGMANSATPQKEDLYNLKVTISTSSLDNLQQAAKEFLESVNKFCTETALEKCNEDETKLLPINEVFANSTKISGGNSNMALNNNAPTKTTFDIIAEFYKELRDFQAKSDTILATLESDRKALEEAQRRKLKTDIRTKLVALISEMNTEADLLKTTKPFPTDITNDTPDDQLIAKLKSTEIEPKIDSINTALEKIRRQGGEFYKLEPQLKDIITSINLPLLTKNDASIDELTKARETLSSQYTIAVRNNSILGYAEAQKKEQQQEEINALLRKLKDAKQAQAKLLNIPENEITDAHNTNLAENQKLHTEIGKKLTEAKNDNVTYQPITIDSSTDAKHSETVEKIKKATAKILEYNEKLKEQNKFDEAKKKVIELRQKQAELLAQLEGKEAKDAIKVTDVNGQNTALNNKLKTQLPEKKNNNITKLEDCDPEITNLTQINEELEKLLTKKTRIRQTKNKNYGKHSRK